MDGKKATNEALQPNWQGNRRPTDASAPTNTPKLAFIGIGRTGSSTADRLRALGISFDTSIIIDTEESNPQKTKSEQSIPVLSNSVKIFAEQPFTPERASFKRFQDQIEHALTQVDVVFFATCLDRDIDAKIASLIAKKARKKGSITVGAITTPLSIGENRRERAPQILEKLRQDCEMVVVINNNEITELAPQIPREEARNISSQAVASVLINLVEAISTPSLINPDFQSFKTIVENGGLAVMSIGESDSPDSLEEAVHKALKGLNNHPLMQIDYARAQGALVHVTGGSGLSIEEARHAGEIVQELMQEKSPVVWGARVKPELEGRIRVILVMTGLASPAIKGNSSSLTPELFDLEPYSKPEKKLPIDLELYQLENF
ncbi:MAG: hypothetical protein NWE78_00830 [Candidatus Bathyarchaeota archaeon]|nr:hypothetical protein [Candidatus Bathyarchaeota archaeon]